MLQGAPKHGAYLAHVIRETVLGFSWQQDGSWGPDSLASPRLVLPYLFSLLGVRVCCLPGASHQVDFPVLVASSLAKNWQVSGDQHDNVLSLHVQAFALRLKASGETTSPKFNSTSGNGRDGLLHHPALLFIIQGEEVVGGSSWQLLCLTSEIDL